MKNLLWMYLFRIFVISLIIFYILFYIHNYFLVIFVLVLIIFLLIYYWKYLKNIFKPIIYFILIIGLALIIANMVYDINTNKKIVLSEGISKISIIRDTINGDSYNLTLGKILEGNLKKKLVVIYTDIFNEFELGDIVETKTFFKRNNNKVNSFDMMFLGKIDYKLDFPELKIVGKQNIFSFWKLISIIRNKIDGNIKDIVGIKNYNLISMWLLGKTKVDNKELNNLFTNLGISHILVVSGTHLSILFNVLGYILIFFISNYYLSIGILLMFLVIFLFLSGVSSAILRSTLFWIILMIGKIKNRVVNYSNVLLIILLIFFILNPLTIVYDIGFHLSFLSIVALIYILPIINKIIKIKSLEKVMNIFNTTLAVTILLLPYLVYQFSEFNVFSVLFNIILIPFSGIILSLAFVALILSFGSIFLGKILGWVVILMTNIFLWMLNILNLINLKLNIFLFNSIFFVIVYYVLLIIICIDFYIKNKKLTFNL